MSIMFTKFDVSLKENRVYGTMFGVTSSENEQE